MNFLRKPLSEETRDQLVHSAVAIVICLLAYTGTAIGWAFAGFLTGMVREVTEEEFDLEAGERRLSWNSLVDVFITSKTDLLFWAAAPFLFALLVL